MKLLRKYLTNFWKKEEISDNLPPECRQIIATLGPLGLTVGFGMVMGYSATLLPQLQNTNITSIIINQSRASWIASMAALPLTFGCIIGGILIEQFGRKFTHILTCLPIFSGWLLIAFARNIEMILFGRFLTGLFYGILTSATGVYISEVSSPNLRGFLLAVMATSVAKGLFLVHLIGTYSSWQTTALVSSAVPLVSLVLLVFVPESPSWLLKKGREEEAKISFVWCRGESDEAKREFAVLEEKQETEDKEKSRKIIETIKEYFVPEFLKPLGIVLVFTVVAQWSGINALAFYTVTIIQKTIPNFDEYLAMLLVDFIRLVVAIVACISLKKYPRRPLAIISGSGTCISLFSLSIFSFLSKLYPKLNTFSSIPVTALIFYISFINLGFVPLPWTMIGELFPLKQRSMGSAVSSFTAMISLFSVVKTTPVIFDNLEPYGAFVIYGLMALFGTIFISVFIPETKGKTLSEIEDDFKKKRRKKKVIRNKYDDDDNFA